MMKQLKTQPVQRIPGSSLSIAFQKVTGKYTGKGYAVMMRRWLLEKDPVHAQACKRMTQHFFNFKFKTR
jgi:hypothetical protein